MYCSGVVWFFAAPTNAFHFFLFYQINTLIASKFLLCSITDFNKVGLLYFYVCYVADAIIYYFYYYFFVKCKNRGDFAIPL